jgi:hypothetical protein
VFKEVSAIRFDQIHAWSFHLSCFSEMTILFEKSIPRFQ